MKNTDLTLIKQLKITRREIERRKEYLGIDEDVCKTLVALREHITEKIDDIVEAFYQKIVVFDEMDQVIGDAETLRRLKNFQRNYILNLFEGQYDEDYVHSRLRVGVVHKRIGVDPKFYISAVHNLISVLRNVAIEKASHGSDCTRCEANLAAIDKILMFDLTLAIDTYIYSLLGEIQSSKEELKHYTESLEEVILERTKLLSDEAKSDGLTDLLNQKAFYSELKRELLRSQRLNHSTVLIYFDLDGFKQLNDTQGHQQGDDILVAVAGAMRRTFREVDMMARYGGDEFCVILAENTLKSAKLVGQRLCKEIEKSTQGSGVACSMGIAISTAENPINADALVKKADKLMYEAKKKKGFTIKVEGAKA